MLLWKKNIIISSFFVGFYKKVTAEYTNSTKPSYHELDRLIHEEWHTEGNVKADEAGVITLGFKGEYDIAVAGKCIKYNLNNLFVLLRVIYSMVRRRLFFVQAHRLY